MPTPADIPQHRPRAAAFADAMLKVLEPSPGYVLMTDVHRAVNEVLSAEGLPRMGIGPFRSLCRDAGLLTRAVGSTGNRCYRLNGVRLREEFRR